MVDVFISYARDNQDVAKRLAEAVARDGYDVWWDDDIPPHVSYSELISEKIATAKAAIVVWSKSAAASEWVRAEADMGRSARKLIQTSVDGTTPPLPFNLIQFAAIGDWQGEDDHPGWKAVKTSIRALCGPPSATPGTIQAALPPDLPPPPPPPPPPSPSPAATQPMAALLTTPPVQQGGGNRGILAIAGVGGAAVLALGAFLWWRGDPPAPQDPTPATNQPQALAQNQPETTQPTNQQRPVATPVAPQQADPALFTRAAAIQGAESINIHAGPAEGFGVIARAGATDPLTTYPQTAPWWRVRTASGRVGYVLASRIRLLEPGAVPGAPPVTVPGEEPPEAPPAQASMEGRWSVFWVWGGVRHSGTMNVTGNSAAININVGSDYRIREDCRVRTTGATVRINCFNVRVLEGKGTYSPDSFDLRLSNARVIRGNVSDTNARVPATFTRH
ncbi:TIR domain-containing protein [Sphingosinicella sp. LHD-64]|uniref:TIR domain-containing protein n=1 Tax=Sphingosinicella sp. LHD-64 TaxID=3072139 RepID=UPI00280D40ED|nr:TIR domain-containing protein [Sphingosinicella sp. LHD-64]MDQ8755130.1 TIR domain-containing protein [Sphingosinicella sp. LHD-64]